MRDESRIALLESALRDGFCLHGSQQNDLAVLEPRPAHCDSGRLEGNLEAVYASRDDVEVPIIMALIAGSGKSQYHRDPGDTALLVTGNRTLRPGTVYILPSDSFEDVNGEWVSFTPVNPVRSLLVSPSILRPLIARGTLDLRIPIPAGW